MASPELFTLVKCREQLTVIMRNDIEAIASFLYLKHTINHQLYREVTNSKSRHSDDDRAEILFRGLEDKVEEDANHFSYFYFYLKSRKQYSKVTSQMNREIIRLRRKRSKLL